VKVNTLLAGFLYDHKILSLQGIGVFSLDDSFYLPDTADKNADFTLTGVHYTHDRKAETDPLIIDYLVKQMGKIKPLVAADLDSHLSLMKQFINLGKPYEIEGIGTLNKTNDGSFVFTPGKVLVEMTGVNHPVAQDHFITEGFFSNQPKKNIGNNKTVAFYALLLLVVVIILAGTGWGIYTLLHNATAEETTVMEDTPVTIDTVPQTIAPPIIVNDSVNYKMIVFQTKWKFKISPLYKTYTNYKTGVQLDSIMQKDTLRYRLFVPMTCIPADTTRLVDSLGKYFNRPIKIAANQ
jgi:hypothetical protein